INGNTLSFPFAGIKFQALANPQAALGTSVAGVQLSSGQYALIIGAPGAQDANGANPGTGRVYVVFGNFNAFQGQTINLDTPTAYTGLTIVTYASTSTGGKLGFSVAGGQNILGDGGGDIIMGAPAASIGAATNTGVVYVVSTATLPSSSPTTPINVNTL